jgi:hypothetical protein
MIDTDDLQLFSSGHFSTDGSVSTGSEVMKKLEFVYARVKRSEVWRFAKIDGKGRQSQMSPSQKKLFIDTVIFPTWNTNSNFNSALAGASSGAAPGDASGV